MNPPSTEEWEEEFILLNTGLVRKDNPSWLLSGKDIVKLIKFLLSRQKQEIEARFGVAEAKPYALSDAVREGKEEDEKMDTPV